MAENSGKKAHGRGDLVSLEETAPFVPKHSAASTAGGDSMLNAAQVFEEQLEQMTTWKHQLAQQMELLRRDGVKLLEKQKNLAVERKRVAEEREKVTADRAYVQKLHLELEQGNKDLSAKGEEITRGLAELQKLSSERENWERQLAEARSHVAAALEEKQKTQADVQVAEARLAELQVLTQRRDAIEQELAASSASLAGVRKELATLEQQRSEFAARAAQAAAREKSLAERELTLNADGEKLRGEQSQLAARRQELERLGSEFAQQRDQLVKDRADAEQKMKAAAGAVEADRAAAQEQLAEAKASLEKLSEARQRQEQRWTSLEARAAELAAAEEQLDRRSKELAQHEQQLKDAKREADEAQGRLLAQQTALIEAEKQVAAKLAEADAAAKALQAERDEVAGQRAELEKKLDLMEGELAEQFENIARQTRRLVDRRAELDARTAGLEKDSASVIGEATAELREQLRLAEEKYATRVQELEAQVRKTEEAAAGWKSRESELERSLEAATQEAAQLKTDLARVGEELNTESRARIQQAELLAEQVMRFEKETADWQRKLEHAMAQGAGAPSPEQLKAALDAAAAARAELEDTRTQLEELTASRQDLELRLKSELSRAADLQKQVEALNAKVQSATRAVEELKEKSSAASKGAKGASKAETDRLASQIKMLEQQRDELAAKLFAAEDALKRQIEDHLLSKNVLDAEILTLRNDKRALEARHAKPITPEITEEAAQHLKKTTDWQRGRLLKKARSLRVNRKEMSESKLMLARASDELAKQREQLRTRKENLEQVKRLLEKQEMVMARKLADHSALKTVAAVGIFVIMILGSSFLGVYKFVSPVYQAEALVQLEPPANLQGPELQAWFARQIEAVKSTDVTHAAWKTLRNEDHYGMHDVREAWIASLGKNLVLQVDNVNSRTMFIRYAGPEAAGVSQVCNALASAYAVPAKDGSVAGKVVAKAAAPDHPSQDNRVFVSLSTVAVVLFVSLVLVMIFRHFVSRQLREIDQMADEADLADLKGELA